MRFSHFIVKTIYSAVSTHKKVLNSTSLALLGDKSGYSHASHTLFAYKLHLDVVLTCVSRQVLGYF